MKLNERIQIIFPKRDISEEMLENVTILTSWEKGNPKSAHWLDHFFPPSRFLPGNFAHASNPTDQSWPSERFTRHRIDRPSRTGYIHLLRYTPESVVGRQDQGMRMRDRSRIVRCPRPVETFDRRAPRSRDHRYYETLSLPPRWIQDQTMIFISIGFIWI